MACSSNYLYYSNSCTWKGKDAVAAVACTEAYTGDGPFDAEAYIEHVELLSTKAGCTK